MPRETYIEKRKRGFFGWLFLLVFLAWNAICLVWLVTGLAAINDIPRTDGDGLDSVRTFGTSIAVGFVLIVWALGAVITGLLALVTRGGKTVVRRIDRNKPDPRF